MKIAAGMFVVVLLSEQLLMVFPHDCFTCRASCHSKRFCNCHTGNCKGDYCFTERFPNHNAAQSSGAGYEIAKGCMKNPPKQELGCDYDRVKQKIFCLCQGDFCNNETVVRRGESVSNGKRAHNATCYSCGRHRSRCTTTCKGDYCFKDFRTGEQSCGYGPPYLSYTYRDAVILRNDRQEYCVSEESGNAWRAQCVCRGNLCNKIRGTIHHPRERSLVLGDQYKELDPPKKIYACYSCYKHDANGVMPTPCDHDHATATNRPKFCLGHYCTVTVATQKDGSLSQFTRIAGCVNSTGFGGIHLGCSQKSLEEKYEVVTCVCRGDYCNSDLEGANRNVAPMAVGAAVLRLLKEIGHRYLTFP